MRRLLTRYCYGQETQASLEKLRQHAIFGIERKILGNHTQSHNQWYDISI
jgi:hypothetical protein